MASVTFSGFNQIDFNVILNAVMAQERQPLQVLEDKQSSLESQATAYKTLATKLAALSDAAEKLATAGAVSGRTAISSDDSIASVGATSAALAGTYDLVVNSLARAQVTASTSWAPDKNETIVASGGTLTIGGVEVAITADVTLQGLAEAINDTERIGVTASIVATAPGSYRLVLTGKETGSANAFTIVNNLAGGASPIVFGDEDGNGVSGDTAGDNAMAAADASFSVNRIAMTSATNLIEEAIPGVSLQLMREAPGTTVTIGVVPDNQGIRERVDKFIEAFNDFVAYYSDQLAASREGDTKAIGRDSLLRGLRREMQQVLSSEYSTGGAYAYLSQAGLGFDRSGKLTLDESAFETALEQDPTGLSALFGTSQGSGAFGALIGLLDGYTRTGGLLQGAQSRISEQLDALARRIESFERRLEVRRAALQREYAAADSIIAQLNTQGSALISLGSQYSLF